ncbi:hypothetical protein QQS21_006122 [Conoideocrella luteorostrata]|uniref:Peptidase S8/S53 domain-containing protein n=1 Tax=Conoideocrella luteorostrata TaxID=1105319 RepID=A0AAJ0CP67_9HYPO|nr:hypothetical protein QQS21_006122 [Conoideocrella luteorostrata]
MDSEMAHPRGLTPEHEVTRDQTIPCETTRKRVYQRFKHKKDDSNVKFVPINVEFNGSGSKTINKRARPPPKGLPRRPISTTGSRKKQVQRNAPWNLARISHRRRHSTAYIYDERAGDGTCVYVLDSGIDLDHRDFEGRASHSVSFWPDSTSQSHGTRVAGIIGSIKYGVAKKTKLLSVQVLNDQGATTTSKLTAGLEYVLNNAQYRSKYCPKGTVVNISLTIPYSLAVDLAARKLVTRGYFVVVAAGNDGDEVSESPATERLVCTVGSSTRLDKIAWGSNHGLDINLFAPGQSIMSTRAGGGYQQASGTSMAAPHVAGVGATLLAQGIRVVDLCNYITSIAVKNAIDLRGLEDETPNLLLSNGFT